MAYLVKNHPDQLFFIDYSSRNGLLYKLFSNTKSVRSNVLYSASTDNYAATKDRNNSLHIACKDKHNQIVHLYQKNSFFQDEVLLDDKDNNYKISNLKLVECNNELHLFYTALNPQENTSDIIQHKINSNDPPRSVIPVVSLDSNYECVTYQDKMYLLSMDKEDTNYELHLSYYNFENNEWEYIDTLISTTNPISHCTMCIDSNHTFHILYVQNQFGQYVTNYLKYNDTNNELDSPIHTCPFNINPIIFVYDDNIWINWEENDHLYMKLSTNYGDSFSDSQLCSLQDNSIKKFEYIYDQTIHENLFGNSFYGSMETYPKLAILNQLDMDSIHLDTKPNNELKLFVTALKSTYRSSSSKQYENLIRENSELKQIQKSISNQYDNLSKLAEQLQKEGKKWRSKYYSAEIELKTYKKKNSNKNTNPLNEN